MARGFLDIASEFLWMRHPLRSEIHPGDADDDRWYVRFRSLSIGVRTDS